MEFLTNDHYPDTSTNTRVNSDQQTQKWQNTSRPKYRLGSLLPLCFTVMSSVLLSQTALAEEQSSANILKIKQEIAHIGDSTPLEPIVEVQPEITKQVESTSDRNPIQQEIAKLQALKDNKTQPLKTIPEEAVKAEVNKVAIEEAIIEPVFEQPVTEVVIETKVIESADEAGTDAIANKSVIDPVVVEQPTEIVVDTSMTESIVEPPVTDLPTKQEMTTVAVEKAPVVAEKVVNEVMDKQPIVEIADAKIANQPIIEQSQTIDAPITLETMRSVDNAPDAYNHYTEIAQRLSIIFHFKTEKNELDSANKQELARLIDYLNEHKTEHIVLMGFADSLGDKEYNSNLSLLRAKVIEKELVDRHFNVVTVSGFGSSVPVASNINAAGRSENRRVEVWIY